LADDFDLARSMIRARDTRGKGLLAQVREIARLAWSRRRITPFEYYRFGLYDDTRYDDAARQRFLGEECHMPLIRQACDLRWWAVTDDKVVTYTMLKAFGAPIAETFALVHPHRIFPGAPTLRDADAVASFLREHARWPVFCKPVSGVSSWGVHLVRRYDPEQDRVVLHDGTSRDVADFARELWSTEGQTVGDGHLLQEVLVPHPELRRLAGDGISSIRALVIVEESGPRLIGAMWKVIGGDEIADNTWRPGSLLAALDLETGEVTRLVRVKGADVEELTHHPRTGERLPGATLPRWAEVVALCERYASIAPKVRFQGWDIAICEDGPRIIEANTGSSFELTQLASGEGMATEDFDRFVRWARSVNETPPRSSLTFLRRL